MSYKIALTGRLRTGKNTVANLLSSQMQGRTEQLAFADALKRELAEMTFSYLSGQGLQQTSHSLDDDFHRFTLDMLNERDVNGLGWQWWGEWRRRHDGEDYWVNHPALAGRYAQACGRYNVIITDMRHLNEAEWCREHGFFLVRVEGPCRDDSEQRDPNHPSERDVDKIPVDTFVINNGTLQELDTKVRGRLMPQIRRFFGATVPNQNT